VTNNASNGNVAHDARTTGCHRDGRLFASMWAVAVVEKRTGSRFVEVATVQSSEVESRGLKGGSPCLPVQRKGGSSAGEVKRSSLSQGREEMEGKNKVHEQTGCKKGKRRDEWRWGWRMRMPVQVVGWAAEEGRLTTSTGNLEDRLGRGLALDSAGRRPERAGAASQGIEPKSPLYSTRTYFPINVRAKLSNINS